MGIRWAEKRLAGELCFVVVEIAVSDYLRECREAGRTLPPYSNLQLRIAATGYNPPGLFNVVDIMESHAKRAREDAERAGKQLDEPILPDEYYLIEGIMGRYPIRRLRAYWNRLHRGRRAHRLQRITGSEEMQQDAT